MLFSFYLLNPFRANENKYLLLTTNSTRVLNRLNLPSRFTQYQRMLSNLAQCEFSMGKTLMVYDMNLREMENYETTYNNIGRAPCICAVKSHVQPHFNFGCPYKCIIINNKEIPSSCRTKHHLCTREDSRMQKRNTESKENTKKSPR